MAYPIFSKVLAQTSGKGVTDNVRAVVDLIAARAAPSYRQRRHGGKFARARATGASSEVELSSEQIGTLTGIGKSAAHRAVRAAIDLGFLVNNEARPRKPYRLVVRQRVDDAAAALLPHPDTLALEGEAAVSSTTNKRARAVCCSLFHVVSTWCETATSLRSIRYLPGCFAVSSFFGKGHA